MQFYILLITAITVQANQHSISCDFHQDTTCIINKTAIEHPTTSINPENSLNFNILNISSTSIKHLPVKLDQTFPNLNSYFVGTAQFQKIIKNNLKNLKKLTSLMLSSKSCTEVDKNAFEDLESLTFLSVTETSIKYIHSSSFGPLKNLETLDLSRNKLEVLHPRSFDYLNKLQILSIANNNLITLNQQLFLNKKSLTRIDSSNNKFQHLDYTTFDGLKLNILKLKQSGCCSLYDYTVADNEEFVDIKEVREDIRDSCRGSDFKIYEIHGRMLEIFGAFGDEI